MNSMNQNYKALHGGQHDVPTYQTPTVTTYTADELLSLIGPVYASGDKDHIGEDDFLGWADPTGGTWFSSQDHSVG